MAYTFHVDLRGIVDLLSHHLYASPRVYVRELLQNATDAITARRLADPQAPGSVRVVSADRSPDGLMHIHDTGIGLTEPQVHELLATIGRSSKRDDLGFARHEFLGQFGIGLLSCFLVADEIRVESRHGDEPTVCWVGFADGRYAVSMAAEPRDEPGTSVTLVPRRGAVDWLGAKTVAELAAFFGSMLPLDVTVDGEPISAGTPPWEPGPDEAPVARRARLVDYCEQVFGFSPFDMIELSVPAAGLRGVAFVLPVPANPTMRVAHRVYLKRMLLSEGIEGLLPEWAFFVRAVVDTTELRPTASRETLYEDQLLEDVRDELGRRLRDWMTGLGRTDPGRLAAFLAVHHLGVKALATHDDEMLRLVTQWWPVETNMGPMTLAEFRDRNGAIRYTPSVDEFRQLAAVAAAQGIPLVNAGYVYDAEIVMRWPAVEEVDVEPLGAADLATRLEPLPDEQELAVRPFLALAQAAVDRLGVEVSVRAFHPMSLPALYLLDREGAFQMDLRHGAEQVDAVWAAILGAFTAGHTDRPQLVLNHHNTLVRQMIAITDGELVRLAVEGLYVQALLLGHHPLRPADTAALNQSFLGLLGRAMGGAP
jgi:molecular chaperone HtpG